MLLFIPTDNGGPYIFIKPLILSFFICQKKLLHIFEKLSIIKELIYYCH